MKGCSAVIGYKNCRRGSTADLLWRAVSRVQDGFVGDVVGAGAQVGGGAQVNELEAAVPLAEDDVQRLQVPVHQASRVQRLLGQRRRAVASGPGRAGGPISLVRLITAHKPFDTETSGREEGHIEDG